MANTDVERTSKSMIHERTMTLTAKKIILRTWKKISGKNHFLARTRHPKGAIDLFLAVSR